MYLIKNLILLKQSNVWGRIPYDGLLKNNHGYFVTCCHGYEDGSMGFITKNKWSKVSPRNVRKNILEHFGITVSYYERVFLLPCFPRKVISRYEESINKYNIRILGEGEHTTCISFFDKKKLVYINESVNKDVKFVDLLARDSEEYQYSSDESRFRIFNGNLPDTHLVVLE